jgi:hypothetical protein
MILHYNSKQEFQDDIKTHDKVLTAYLVTYVTKKGNIKVVKNRWGPQGKFTKEQFCEMLTEFYLQPKEEQKLELLTESSKKNAKEMLKKHELIANDRW